MGNMTQGQLKARRTWLLSGIDVIVKNPATRTGFAFHTRGFHKGDICCTRCDKYLNPNNPEEAKEIKVTPGGKKVHISKYCKYYGNGFGCAVFRTVPRHSKQRKRKIDEAKRY